jgi:hypothetical protein
MKIGAAGLEWNDAGENHMAVAGQERDNTHKTPRPTPAHFANKQLSLFQNFLCNTEAERDQLSNAVDLWDNVPRYSISRQAMTKSRIEGRFLEKYQAEFQYRGRTYTMIITPARVKDLDGVDREFYPSATEELVEDALRKLAADQHRGWFDQSKPWSGVIFTLHALRQELQRRGHTRSYQEIVLALDILHKSNIEISVQHQEGQPALRTTSETYLPHITVVSRGRLREDPKAKWLVRFHLFVTLSIDQLTYRQFNYHLMMSHTTQLARWLHKQLALKYTFASIADPFEMRYSTVKRDSGLLNNYARERDAIDALHKALTELQEHEVLISFTRQNIVGPRSKLLDAIFKLIPTPKFSQDMKASNRRLANANPSPAPKAVGIGRGSGAVLAGIGRDLR